MIQFISIEDLCPIVGELVWYPMPGTYPLQVHQDRVSLDPEGHYCIKPTKESEFGITLNEWLPAISMGISSDDPDEIGKQKYKLHLFCEMVKKRRASGRVEAAS